MQQSTSEFFVILVKIFCVKDFYGNFLLPFLFKALEKVLKSLDWKENTAKHENENLQSSGKFQFDVSKLNSNEITRHFTIRFPQKKPLWKFLRFFTIARQFSSWYSRTKHFKGKWKPFSKNVSSLLVFPSISQGFPSKICWHLFVSPPKMTLKVFLKISLEWNHNFLLPVSNYRFKATQAFSIFKATQRLYQKEKHSPHHFVWCLHFTALIFNSILNFIVFE